MKCLVKGSWLKACGKGSEDKVFEVRSVEKRARGFDPVTWLPRKPWTFITVEDGSARGWLVCVELRDCELIED